MATEMPAETDATDERWRRMWSHREQLLKVARRRSMSQEDAEDAVHDAMLRAAERPDLDEERLGAWLTTVTMRLCVDRYRQVNREAEVRVSPRLVAPGPVPVEEAVCDRAEAKWLAVRSGELPDRQAEALWLKSEDLDVGQVAVKMGLSYRTVESLLARARRTLRNSLAATLGFVLFLLGRGRLKAGGKAQAVAVASTAATLAVAGFVLPYTLDGGGTTKAPHPSVTPGAAAVRTDRTDRTGTGRAQPSPASSATSPPPPAAGSPSDGTQVVPLSVTPLPQVSAPTVPKVPGIPSVPRVSGLPKVTQLPDLPTTPVESAVPSLAVPSVSLPTSALSTLPSVP
ncbi:sigma-70 family RNA polymerase sigma factor [Streptomyces griseorubiginosus]|uniref:sigma-70 family RNA polymerase sigma factor n=1 Tax=Streptomyces griseorubiginosus TaxID=67304 RepID=UPI001AD778EC|nr:sigma-70 family RNA polymerase sigma factor [Streptomyces griseorubiginosus]MBO4254250.1 sigma-70 family RNA polymerase sigma factor [Streptomyces griseorubiginosus]